MTHLNNSSVDFKKVINKTVDLNYSTQIFNSSQIMKTTKDNTSIEPSKSLSKINVSKKETKEKINQNRSNSNKYKKIKIIHSSSKERIKPSSEKQHIIRSIVLPNNDKNEMIKEVEFLKNQIQDIRNFSDDQIRKQQTIAKEYETELKLHLENEKQKYSELLKSKQKNEEVSILLTKELLNIKCDYANNERKIYEELDLSKLQNQALISAMKELSDVMELDKENYLIEQERKTNQVLNNLRTKLKNYQENVRIMKEQYRQIQAIFNSRMNELIENYNKLLEKNKELETKFFKNVATSGSSHFIKASKSIGNFDNMTLLVSEINNLNKRLKQIENMDLNKDPILEIEKTKSLVINKSKSLVKFTNKHIPLAKKSSKLKIENNKQSINFPSKEININKIELNDFDRKISEPNSTKNKLLNSLKPSDIRKKMKEKMKENDTKEKKESKATSVTKDNSKKVKMIGELKKQFGDIENMVNSMK